ncbi:hypothetical protein FQA39_LY12084 [Lamprigera yunnana]|nr:hypothetical protein FQA39_LY12084 [Lamprigera yunnana]
MLSAWMTDQEFNNYTRQEEINRKAKYRQELQDQMILDDKNKRYAYEEFLKEKKMIDAVVQRIHEENERQTEERMHKMKRTQQEIDAFKEAQQVWKERQRNKIMEENKKIEEYISTKINNWKTMQEEKESINAIKTEICDNLAKQLCKQEVSFFLCLYFLNVKFSNGTFIYYFIIFALLSVLSEHYIAEG